MFLFPKAAHNVRLPAEHADGQVKFQRVRFLQNRTRPLTFAIFAFPLTFLLLETSEYWLPDEYKKALQRTRARTEEEKTKGQAKTQPELIKSGRNQTGGSPGTYSDASGRIRRPEDLAFLIRLPIIRQKHPVPYQEKDKEWKEACKLEQDHKRILALKRLITEETFKGWVRDNATFDCIKQVCRGDKAQGVENTLEIVVPLHRPPKFEQVAIAWLPDGPHQAKIQLSNTTASRIMRIWYPEVSFKAFWNAGTTFTYASYQLAKTKFQDYRSTNTTVASSSTSPSVASPSPQTRTTTSNGQAVIKTADGQLMASFRNLARTLTPESPIAQAKMAFLRTTSVLQLQALQQIPEGAVVFQGYVSIVGYRGKVKSTISAIYMPAEDRLILPIIIERTEVLPNTTRWHKIERLPFNQTSPASATTKKPWSAADKLANMEQRASAMSKIQRDMESRVANDMAFLERHRRHLAEDIERLNKEGIEAGPLVKRQARARIYRSEEDYKGGLADALDRRSSTDPRLKQLIDDIARGTASLPQRREFDRYVDSAYAMILAQNTQSKRAESGGKPSDLEDQSEHESLQPLGPRSEDPKKVKDKEVLQEVKGLKEVKDIHSGKTEENEKSSSDSIETARKEEQKKD